MVELSLRSHLSKIGEVRSKASLGLKRDFHVLPTSLKKTIEAMQSPKPAEWTKTSEQHIKNKDWTHECQGVTHDASFWYISSNKGGKQRVYRISFPGNKVEDYVKLAGNGSGHLGDIDYYQGRIYCAMEGPVKIIIINTPPFKKWWAADLLGESGGAPPQKSCPWSAINPWNGLLYSSNNGDSSPGEDTLHAYRLDEKASRFLHVPSADIVLQEKVRRIQGAVFSKNGHVLIASNDSDDIRCYSILNGHYLGRAEIPKKGGFPEYEEVEGLTIWEGKEYDGVATHVHVVLLDNDSRSKKPVLKKLYDDVHFKHYRVPSWTHL